MKAPDDWWAQQSSRDHARDRAAGQLWERRFCAHAARFKKSFTPHQIGRRESAVWYQTTGTEINPFLLPDTTIWTAPGEHHEIKHKKPTKFGCFGLEAYRFKALLDFREETQQPVLYTIHNWESAGAQNSQVAMPNRLEDWITVDVEILRDYVIAEHLQTTMMQTYVNGPSLEMRPGYYWPTTLWFSLEWWWRECPF